MSGKTSGQKIFELTALKSLQESKGERYFEFLRESAMSAGLYTLAPDAADPQLPHREDELYVVLAGRAVLDVDGTGHPVSTGAVCYVPAAARHHFHTITEELRVLVLFAPAETVAAA